VTWPGGRPGRLLGKTEQREQLGVGEAGDLADQAGVDGQDHDAVGLGRVAVVHVGGHGGLAVGPGGDQPDLGQASAGRHGGEEGADGVPAAVGHRGRGHGQQAVLGQHRYQGGDVARVPCAHEVVRERSLGARGRGSGLAQAPGCLVDLQGGPCPLQRAVHRCLAGSKDARSLRGGKAKHVAQQQHGALPGRQQLDDGQEGQLDALAQFIAGGGVAEVPALGQFAQPLVGVGLQRGDLDIGGVRRRVRRGEDESGGGGGAGAGSQAPVGRDPVQPPSHRAVPVEAGQVPPGAHKGLLQDVLGIVHRSEHPVAVHVQFTDVGGDEDAESLLIARPGPCQQRLLAPRGRAVGHGWSAWLVMAAWSGGTPVAHCGCGPAAAIAARNSCAS